eukprot:4157551-Amphidinium_carterae.1
MTIIELRAAIREGDGLQERARAEQGGGAYIMPPPLPGLQRWKERLEILESQRQEEEDRLEQHRQVEQRVRQQEATHLAEGQARRQTAADKAEREHQEELERQAALTSVPTEQVGHAEVRQQPPPLIGEGQEVQGAHASRAETVNSSSTGSSTSTSNSRATTCLQGLQTA